MLAGAAAGATIGMLLSSKKKNVKIKKLAYKGKDALERLQRTMAKAAHLKNAAEVPTL